ncbi:MAG TPA: acyl-CoA dehydrogenase family protein [Casimicrobiaceae bacterium]|jgi:acyl-CoA dehydrogenase|nr:acyl-CoA dehydrogenase family protein [Casimicrobiaceae bacterium]
MDARAHTGERGDPSGPTVHDTPERLLLREQVSRFVAREVEPNADAWEHDGRVPRQVIARLGQLGWLGLQVPEVYGGSGVDPITNFVFAEALSRSTYGGFVVTVLVHTDMASPHLVHAGTEAQKARWLPGIVRGDIVAAIAVTEANAGSDVARIRTTARRDGADFVLDGSKMFITNGVHADLYFVAARTAPLETGSRGLSIFAVEKGAPGFRVGQVLDKTGWRSSDTAELVFDGCRVPAADLLGNENEGFRALMRNFQRERLALAAMAIGNAMSSLALALEHARTREAFGGALWQREAIRQKLALLDARTQALRAFAYHCAWLDSERQDCVREISQLKALAGELANDVAYGCQQCHGGIGYIRESAIERLWRDARILSIGGGATEVMLEEAAKRL